jgi:hypothetical protein
MRSLTARARPCALAVATTAAMALSTLGASPADASKRVQLRFFSHQASSSITDPAGNPVTDLSNGFAPGDKIVATDVNYAGNHKHHAKRYSSTDHLVCTFTGATTAVCDGQFAIGGSMLLVENVTIDFSNPKLSFPITGGTGKFRGRTGALVSTSLGNGDNSDDVINLH